MSAVVKPADQRYGLEAFASRPSRFLHHLRMGAWYGYPACCVRQFAVDCLNGRSPGLLRGRGPWFPYVPCDVCAAAMAAYDRERARRGGSGSR